MTAPLLQESLGAALALAGWVAPRRVAGARVLRPLPLILDACPAALAASLLLIATGRPVFAGLVVFSLGAGLAFADRVKRQVLREPVVFSDMSELPHLFTHPQLYLPFAGPRLVVGAAAAAIGVAGAILWFEPPLWRPGVWPSVLAPAIVCGAGWLLSREPALGAAAGVLRRLAPTGDAFGDGARLGPFATLLVYGVIARAERARRRARHVPRPATGRRRSAPPAPLIVVQCESFFDARRLAIGLPSDFLAGFDALRAGATFGRLAVGAWGANTMRAEFAVLTGIGDEELGYDRFNPYHAFARAPVNSLAWDLREAGYRTICLHPFDRGFFGRDRVLPALGFDSFLGRESIGGSRLPPYLSDPQLAHRILATLDAVGERSFIFAITMGNHGPWLDARWPADPRIEAMLGATKLPQGDELRHYLAGLEQSDEMLRILVSELGRRRFPGVFAFYGDHLPSLPRTFDHLGFADTASDYVLWRRPTTAPRRIDLPAHRLPRLIGEALAAGNAREPSVARTAR